MQHFLGFGGQTVKRVITTRMRHIVKELECHELTVDVMQEGEAVDLLASNLSADAQTRNSLKPLAKILSYWALPLSLSNGRLRERLQNKRTVADAIRIEMELLREGGLSEFNTDLTENQRRIPSLSLKLSIDLLDSTQRGLFLDLAIFPEDEVIPVALIYRLWKARLPNAWQDKIGFRLLYKLFGLSLLQKFIDSDDSNAHIKLHDIVLKHLHDLCGNSITTIHQALVDSYKDANNRYQLESSRSGYNLLSGKNYLELQYELTYIWKFIKHHLYGANRKNDWFSLLFNIEFIAKRTWILAGPVETAQDLDEAKAWSDQSGMATASNRKLIACYKHAAHLLTGSPSWQELGRILIQKLWSVLTLEQFRGMADLNLYLPMLVPVSPPPDQPSFTEEMDGSERREEGHAAWVVSCLQLSANQFVSTSSDKTVKLWTWTGRGQPKVTATLRGHSGKVRACAKVSEELLVTAGEDGRLVLWDVNNRVIFKLLVFHTKAVIDCTVIADGRVVSVSEDGCICLWNPSDAAKALTPSKILDRQPQGIYPTVCVASSDGEILITGYSNATIKIKTAWASHRLDLHPDEAQLRAQLAGK
ncbi:hypothetical protein, partial [Candidatus Magnetaquicoccus inordinatus]|uniref:hypothetical protein n=1 Tax=Candidatus Magnetaquicoccus inordinatus TaxID=2496818 RepID=UPI00102C2F72